MDNPGCSCSFCQPKIEAGILARSNLVFVFDNWPFHRRSVLDPSQQSSLPQIAWYLQTRFPHASFQTPGFQIFYFSDCEWPLCSSMKTKRPAEIQGRLKRRETNTKRERLRFGQFQKKCCMARLKPIRYKFVQALRSVYLLHACHHRHACEVTLPVSRLKGLYECMHWSGRSSDSER